MLLNDEIIMSINPPSSDWRSPLKVQEPTAKPQNAVPTKLFFTEPEETSSLTEIYKHELDKPPFEDNGQFFIVRDMVSAINDVIKSRPASSVTSSWIERVTKVLQEPIFDKKMAELGMILFYLSKDSHNFNALFHTPCLMDFRAQELKQEVESYIQNNAGNSRFPCIPSGKTHYLMRAFAHMVLSTNYISNRTVYNRGGLIAIREFLTAPSYQIAKFLQPEHIDHIIAIVNELLSSRKNYEALFTQNVQVADSLQDLIRIDLKLTKNHPIHSVLVLYDCLMALFADVRQFDYGNCYAVGALIYATENHTHKTVSKMVEWLHTGYFNLEGQNIPIRSLVEGRSDFCKDFDTSVNAKSALASQPVGHILSTLSLKSPKTEAKEQPLCETVASVLKANHADDQMRYVAQLYNGYKYNMLAEMLIALLEFATNSSSASYARSLFVSSIVFAALSGDSVPRDKRDTLRTALKDKIWFQSGHEKIRRVNQGTFQIGIHEIVRYDGNSDLFHDTLSDSRRAYFLDSKGKFRILRSITDLKAAIQSVMQEIGLTDKIDDKTFRRQIASFCEDQISTNKSVPAKHLETADLLIFRNIGGREEEVLEITFGIKVQTHIVPASNTPYKFLDNLFTLIKALGKETLAPHPRILISGNTHTWTINPSCWKLFFESKNTFYGFVQRHIFIPAEKRLSSQIPKARVQAIIDRAGKDGKQKATMTDFFAAFQSLTFRNMRRELTEQFGMNSSNIRTIVDEEFSTISLTKQQLTRVLKKLNITVDSQTYYRIAEKIVPQNSLSFKLALELRNILIEEKIAVIDPNSIEVAICLAAQMPLPFTIGDSNWVDMPKEDFGHVHFCTHFSFWDHTLNYYTKRDTLESEQSYYRFKSISLRHPKEGV